MKTPCKVVESENTTTPSRILVVDDEPKNRQITVQVLKSTGCELSEAATGEEAFQSVRDGRPDLVLLDVNLPDALGFDVCRRIKADAALKDTHIIMFSSVMTDPESQAAGLEAGADGYMARPIHPREFLARIQATLRIIRVEAQLREWSATLEQKVSEHTAELARSNERLRLTQYTVDDSLMPIFWIRPTGALMYANDAACQHLGYARKELLHLSVWDFDPDYPQHSWKQSWSLMKQKRTMTFESRHRRQDGTMVAVEIHTNHHQFEGEEFLFVFVADITQRKRMEDNLRKLSQAVEQSPASIVITDPAGNIEYTNPKFTELTGYTFEEARGQKVNLLKPVDTPGETYQDLWQTISQGREWRGEFMNRKKTGELFWEYARISPIVDQKGQVTHYVAAKEDITERKQAMEQLRINEERLRALVDSAADAIISVNTGGLIISWNPAAERIFGYHQSEVIGRPVMLIMPERFRDAHPKAFARAVEQGAMTLGSKSVELAGLHKEGREFPIELTVARYSTGAGCYFTGMIRDITARKKAQQEVAQRTRSATFPGKIGRALTQEKPFECVLHDCMKIMVKELGAAFARIWTLNRQTQTLELQASAGLYTHLNGAHSRVPVGHLKIGRIAQEKQHYLTNDVQHDARIGDPEWARREAMVAFAGYPLMVGEDVVGVTAMFSRCELNTLTLEALASVANSIAVLIRRRQAEQERQMLEIQLRQSQKLESVGRLAAGIAHEINTPTQYIGDNNQFLKDAFDDLNRLLSTYAELSQAAANQPLLAEKAAEIRAMAAQVDVEYLLAEIPRAISQSLEGVQRVTKIVRAMKEFSHPGAEEKTAIDLNRAIESTATVCRNEWKYVADLVLDTDPALPPVLCLPGEFNQVILNLIINAAHAIADVKGDGSQGKGMITIRTRAEPEWVEVRIADTGAGIPETIRSRMFEPFFTTKAVGKGTGQGLAIARSVIVDKHGGTITFESEVGQGTVFIIRLPLGDASNAKGK